MPFATPEGRQKWAQRVGDAATYSKVEAGYPLVEKPLF
jgi:hypothetical protein